jgi:type I restriction-modification system DNA methylase subunit
VDDLFVKVLGYTLYPQPGYNFVLEKKTETDSTKSDGAILSPSPGGGAGGGQVVAVLELKDTSATDLDKVEKQAFGYKHRHRDCNYVIISNFQKLRFYINDATEYEEFNLFTLTKERFEVLYLCLSQQNFFNGIVLQVKQASITEEELVTKKLYADYSSFRKKLFHNIAEKNPQHDKVELFKRTQKLLDRFLFILFAEDRLLVPTNSVRKILDEWKQLKDLDAAQPLYRRFRLYFGYLNTGRPAAGNKEEIFAYNGGLFAPDEMLDNLLIDDCILYESSVALSNYDYQTEVDVNILGHIFEHSLTEIEELERSISSPNGGGREGTTKRKKDGVFYTPRYITKYIVENTIGALCKQKKEELQLKEEDYAPLLKKKNQKQLLDKLTAYRNWLLQLTICDPACGSGDFLNQALEFLIAEHRQIDELDAKLGSHSIIYSDVEKSILENNLYGVDINEEAVEIAKLSLWLRTAQKGRRLTSLNENIKCGNSLIDDAAIAGNNAFNWQKEFPGVFSSPQGGGREGAGFDVVIGNPPYVDIKALPKNITEYLFKNIKTANNRINLFSVFIEKSLVLLNEHGKFSFIIPSSLLAQESYKELRKTLLQETNLDNIVRLPNESFGGSAGEVKVDTIILTFGTYKTTEAEISILVYKGFDRINEISTLNTNQYIVTKQSEWEADENFVFRINVSNEISKVISKIEDNTDKLVDCADFSLGLTPYDKYRGHTEE